jgi:hypothetical protein
MAYGMRAAKDKNCLWEARSLAYGQMATLLGAHCCLCGAIGHNPLFPTVTAFWQWLCRPYDRPGFGDIHTPPLCSNCNSQIIIFSAKNNGTKMGAWGRPTLTQDQFPDVLCAIFSDRSFRKRVEENAGPFRTIRFDPRRAPEPSRRSRCA